MKRLILLAVVLATITVAAKKKPQPEYPLTLIVLSNSSHREDRGASANTSCSPDNIGGSDCSTRVSSRLRTIVTTTVKSSDGKTYDIQSSSNNGRRVQLPSIAAITAAYKSDSEPMILDGTYTARRDGDSIFLLRPDKKGNPASIDTRLLAVARRQATSSVEFRSERRAYEFPDWLFLYWRVGRAVQRDTEDQEVALVIPLPS
jgi:hypothetical protein